MLLGIVDKSGKSFTTQAMREQVKAGVRAAIANLCPFAWNPNMALRPS
jgi:hypothetical protein